MTLMLKTLMAGKEFRMKFMICFSATFILWLMDYTNHAFPEINETNCLVMVVNVINPLIITGHLYTVLLPIATWMWYAI